MPKNPGQQNFNDDVALRAMIANDIKKVREYFLSALSAGNAQAGDRHGAE